ncbi:hypothetical protein ACJMK2_035589 [Sinanodonta woodiana]|uniref:CCHC-type domain-containing protein n=1 Tax=Sinanodonta woodiana TaxID=1069815 RepID=A0ABD3WZC0_SINWO
MITDLRVHWLPLYISDQLIEEVLSPFGKVLDITIDKTLLDKDTMTFNGTRNVKLQTTEFDSRHIPHIVSLCQCGMLITMKGRPSICLKCRQSGHLRKDCPEKSSTYASVTTTRKSPPQPSIATPPVPAPQVSSPPDSEINTSPVSQEPLVDPSTTAVTTPDMPTEEVKILTSGDKKNSNQPNHCRSQH